MNSAMPISQITTMDAIVSRSIRERRFQFGLLICFAAAALMLSAIGIYGVMNRATQARTHEIGVRMAIGADAGAVRWMVLRGASTIALAGILGGSAIAVALSRYMSSMIFGITPFDPITYVSAALVLLAAAITAAWVPAWRASRIDPAIALRND